MGIDGWITLALESAMVGMGFLSERAQRKLNEEHKDVITEYRKQQNARSPHYNDARMLKAREKKRDFITAYNLAARGERND